MVRRRFVVEFGLGVDQHGQDPTNAARKAVADAISRSCLCGLREVVGLKDLNEMLVEVKVGCPYPEKVNRKEVLEVLPLGQKKVEIVPGGLTAQTIVQPELGDTSDEALVATAAVTVWVDMPREDG